MLLLFKLSVNAKYENNLSKLQTNFASSGKNIFSFNVIIKLKNITHVNKKKLFINITLKVKFIKQHFKFTCFISIVFKF